MKKLFVTLLAVITLLNTTAFAGFEGNFLDPLNNDLFEVVAELDYYDEYNLNFYYRDKVYKDDMELSKVVETIINYDGTVIENDLCDFMPNGEADGYLFSDDYFYFDDESTFNDGLIKYSNMEEYEFGYNDISGKPKYTSYAIDYFGFDYNLGILQEIENNGFAWPDIVEVEFKTTFTNIMTDNKTYEFNCAVNSFNDDGYSLMRYNGKMYVIKLRNGVIPTVYYNGKKIKFDQIPVIESGRTLVPLRAIFETFGADVQWDGETQTVTATNDDTEVKLTINNTTAYKNGEAVTLDVPAKIINGRTLVPVRFVSDCFDVSVDWDSTMLKINLTK